MVFHNELEADAGILLNHLRGMAKSLRKLTPEQWDWTYAPAAPTPRMIGTHTLAWLQCDRQHINNPDATSHKPTPDSPTEPEAICLAIEAEADEWETLLNSLTLEDLSKEYRQFGLEDRPMNVRGFVAHMVQNVIYKHGQFATIFFALGFDGTVLYKAPYPNDLYREFLGIG